jgi:hypothetical protein
VGSVGPTVFQGVASTLAAGDFNRDGRADLVFAGGFVHFGQGTMLLTSLGGGRFSDATTIGPPATALRVCDFNGDGLLDIVAATTQSGLVVLLGRGDGTFTQNPPVAAGLTVSSLVAADLDGDGKCDIVFTTFSGVFWIRGQGDGGFGSVIQLVDGGRDLGTEVPLQLTGLSASDLNGDGLTDLAFGTNDLAIYVVVGTGGGRFSALTRIPTTDHVAEILSADVNGDGRTDLLLLKRDVNALQILQGTADGRFSPLAQAVLGTDPASMAVGDFDSDGRPDIVVTDSTSGALGHFPGALGHLSFLMNSCGKRESLGPVPTPRSRPRVVRRTL